MTGGDLGELLASGRGLERGHALAVVGQVAAALGPEHARGWAHGAIEPANVLLEGDRAVLTGFGAGRDHPREGAPDYHAPELFDGAEPTPRSDVYSLAALLCAALTGAPPRGGHVPPRLPPSLASLLEVALSVDPARRPADAAALMNDVRAALAADVAPPAARRRWWRRRGRATRPPAR
jgi:serine/threonine protein kinase